MSEDYKKYDLIIVGAGIAGLRVGIESLKMNPSLKCCILEKYGYIGGRVITWHKKLPMIGHVQWENGAGRISTSHKRVLELIKEYRLTFTPISPETKFIDDNKHHHITIQTNTFSELQGIYLEPLLGLSKEILATHTLDELLVSVFGLENAKQFYEQFPYFSEIHTLRADIALISFKHEMHSNEGYGVS